MNSYRSVAVVRWIFASSALAGIVLVYRHWFHVNPTTVALTLLLFILLLAAEWGLRYAVVVSLAATACYNFFFLPPVGTFIISDPQNWLALFAFLITAIVASRLSHRARNQANEARSRQQELEVLFRLSRELLETESVAALLSSIPFSVASVTGAGSVLLFLLDGDRVYRAGNETPSHLEIPQLRQISNTLTTVDNGAEEAQLPLRTGVRPKGLLLLRGVSLSSATLEAIAGLISMSMERAHALESVARGNASRETERLRTLMIDSITHELRTPLTSIKGAATILMEGGMEGENSRELLTLIDEESDRLNKLVSEAVEMAQLDAQKVQMHREPINVVLLIEEARKACSWVDETHIVHMNVPTHLMMDADPSYLKKVVCNLLENAAKYSKPSTTITVSAVEQSGFIAVSIADKGIGIDPSEQSLIFERFYRARSSNDGSTGTGMGLAISRSIIETHGGRIQVTSQPNQGSVFTFTLRAASADPTTRELS